MSEFSEYDCTPRFSVIIMKSTSPVIAMKTLVIVIASARSDPVLSPFSLNVVYSHMDDCYASRCDAASITPSFPDSKVRPPCR